MYRSRLFHLTGHSGSGAAGRIALHLRTENTFFGSYLAFSSPADLPANTGAAGTVYLKDVVKGFDRHRLFVNNRGGPINRYATVEEGTSITSFQFDEVEVLRQGSLHFVTSVPTTMNARLLRGDRSGLIHVHDQQTMTAEYEDSRLKAFTTGMNFIIDEGAELIVPAYTYIYGDHDHAVHWLGQLTGVSLFVVGQEKTVYLGATARTAYLQNGTYLYVDSPGNITFGTLDLRGKSSMEFGPDVSMHAEIGFVDVRYLASIKSESIHLKTSRFSVEAGATVTVAAGDRPNDRLDSSEGQGATVTATCCGSAAGHASVGGGVYQADQTVTTLGGGYYGSLRLPQHRGSHGGNSSSTVGGRGGGIMQLTVGGRAFIDGDLLADASPGGTYSGGGSGGSILLQTNIFEGYGTVSVTGGAGATGGSGGRIAVYTKAANHFSGTLTAKGGLGTGPYLSSGGPGSVYVEELRFGFPYRKLYLDNSKHHWDQYYMLDEPGVTSYLFDELHLINNASLQMVAGRQQNLTVVKAVGDRTGRVHAHANHTVMIDINQRVTKTPVNLWIDRQSRVFLAPLVYILGVGQVALKWEGEIIGVRHLRIVPGRNIQFGSQAQTSFMNDGVYVAGEPGWFRFGSFELGAGASIALPPPQGLRLTVGFLVSLRERDDVIDSFNVDVIDSCNVDDIHKLPSPQGTLTCDKLDPIKPFYRVVYLISIWGCV